MNFLMYDANKDLLEIAIETLKDAEIPVSGTTDVSEFEARVCSGLYDGFIVEPYGYSGDPEAIRGYLNSRNVIYFTCNTDLDLTRPVYKLDWEELEARCVEMINRKLHHARS